jgi:hypothetical protein
MHAHTGVATLRNPRVTLPANPGGRNAWSDFIEPMLHGLTQTRAESAVFFSDIAGAIMIARTVLTPINSGHGLT